MRPRQARPTLVASGKRNPARSDGDFQETFRDLYALYRRGDESAQETAFDLAEEHGLLKTGVVEGRSVHGGTVTIDDCVYYAASWQRWPAEGKVTRFVTEPTPGSVRGAPREFAHPVYDFGQFFSAGAPATRILAAWNLRPKNNPPRADRAFLEEFQDLYEQWSAGDDQAAEVAFDLALEHGVLKEGRFEFLKPLFGTPFVKVGVKVDDHVQTFVARHAWDSSRNGLTRGDVIRFVTEPFTPPVPFSLPEDEGRGLQLVKEWPAEQIFSVVTLTDLLKFLEAQPEPQRNPMGDGAEWSEMEEAGEVAFEREHAVRDAVMRDTYLADFRPDVFSALSPKGKRYLEDMPRHSPPTGMPVATSVGWAFYQGLQQNQVFVVLTKYKGENAHINEKQFAPTGFERALKSLNKDWAMPGWEWKLSPWGWGFMGNEFLVEFAPMNAAKQNPGGPKLEPGEVFDEYERLLEDPDPASSAIIEDLLLENNTTLAIVSRDALDMWEDWKNYPKELRWRSEATAAGVFVLDPSTEGMHKDNAGSSMGRTTVEWMVEDRASNNVTFSLDVVVTYESFMWHSNVWYGKRFDSLDEAIHQAVSHAWHAVKVMKEMAGRPRAEVVQTVDGHPGTPGVGGRLLARAVRQGVGTEKHPLAQVPVVDLHEVQEPAPPSPARAGIRFHKHPREVINPASGKSPNPGGTGRPPHSDEEVLGEFAEQWYIWVIVPLAVKDVYDGPVRQAAGVGYFVGSGRSLIVNEGNEYQWIFEYDTEEQRNQYLPAFQAIVGNVGRVEFQDDGGMIDNPCESDMEPKQNPAWVTKHLADSWVTLEQKVPAKWLPKLDRTVSKGKRLSAEIPEYGCGAYGCVLPTLDPAVVLKLTTDDTEAQFAARLAKQLPVPICTHYELVFHLPTAKRKGRDVYLLWREAAEHVGEVDKVVGSHAEDAIAVQHRAAQEAFDKLSHQEPAERELAAWVSAVKGMGKVPELRWLADGMLAAYEKKGIGFFDVHGGNIGFARGQWVITDPGHVAVVPRGGASSR